jgi:hypothetical protein
MMNGRQWFRTSQADDEWEKLGAELISKMRMVNNNM